MMVQLRSLCGIKLTGRPEHVPAKIRRVGISVLTPPRLPIAARTNKLAPAYVELQVHDADLFFPIAQYQYFQELWFISLKVVVK